MKILTSAIVISMSVPFAALASQDDKLTIVVNTFQNPANYRRSTIGNALTEMFVTSLSRSGKFTVIDAQGGGPFDADLYFSAKVTNFSYQEEEVAASASDRSQEASDAKFRQIMTVRIDMTVVDGTRSVVFAEKVGHRETNTSATAMRADYDRLLAASVTRVEMENSLMGRATETAVERAAERVSTYFSILGTAFKGRGVEGRIVGLVDARTAVMDQGRIAGIRVNEELEVLRGEPFTNADGEVVFTRRFQIGTAVVSEVQDQGALIVVDTEGEIREGDLVMRPAPKVSVSDHVEKGHAFLDADFNQAAIREYQAARQLEPSSMEMLSHLGMAYIKAGDDHAAFDSLSEVLNAGVPIELAARHLHSFGECSGTFTLTKDTVAYHSPAEEDPNHWFEVPISRIVKHDRRLGPLLLRAPSREQEAKNEGKTKNWRLHFSWRNEHGRLADFVVRFIANHRQ